MSSDFIIDLNDVWKKYSTSGVFHRSIREDIVNILKRKNNDRLAQTEFWALKGISFSLREGECIGLYGPNGSGKSSILKLVASVTYPTKGKVTVNGVVAPLIELGAGFHPDLTGRENIYLNGTIIGMTIKEIREKMDEIIAFSELDKFIDMPVKKYSSGMYLRLGFSIAIQSNAEILLMDEILAVGDEQFQHKCINKIRELRTRKTMVIVSHNLPLMTDVTDRIVFLNNGKLTS